MPAPVPAWLGALLPAAGAGAGGLAVAGLGNAELAGRGGLRLTSAAFADGEALDPSFTALEEDAVAPPLEWTAPPPGSAELVLLVEDPDGPGGQAFCHWLVWGLAPQRGKLLEGEAPPRVGKNSFGNSEWLLPDPMPGDDARTLVFQLFALDSPLALLPGATRADVLAAMAGHVTGVALLTASFAAEDDLAEDDLAEDDWEEAQAEE